MNLGSGYLEQDIHELSTGQIFKERPPNIHLCGRVALYLGAKNAAGVLFEVSIPR